MVDDGPVHPAARSGGESGPAVVWAYRRTGKFAFHVLTGALESDPRVRGVSIEFANGVDAVVIPDIADPVRFRAAIETAKDAEGPAATPTRA